LFVCRGLVFDLPLFNYSVKDLIDAATVDILVIILLKPAFYG